MDPRIVELKNLGYKVRMEDADLATLLRAYRPDLPNDPVSNVLSVAVEETASFWSDVEQGICNPANATRRIWTSSWWTAVPKSSRRALPCWRGPKQNQVLDETRSSRDSRFGTTGAR